MNEAALLKFVDLERLLALDALIRQEEFSSLALLGAVLFLIGQ